MMRPRNQDSRPALVDEHARALALSMLTPKDPPPVRQVVHALGGRAARLVPLDGTARLRWHHLNQRGMWVVAHEALLRELVSAIARGTYDLERMRLTRLAVDLPDLRSDEAVRVAEILDLDHAARTDVANYALVYHVTRRGRSTYFAPTAHTHRLGPSMPLPRLVRGGRA